MKLDIFFDAAYLPIPTLIFFIQWRRKVNQFISCMIAEFFILFGIFDVFYIEFLFSSLTVWDILQAVVFIVAEAVVVVSILHNLTIPDENRVFLPILDIWCHFRSREEIRRKWKVFVKTTSTKMDNNNITLKEKNFWILSILNRR